MSKTAVVTARVDPELLARTDALAAALDRSRGWVLARAIERYVEEEQAFLAFVQVGLNDVAAGRTRTQEEVEALFGIGQEQRDVA